MKRQHICHLTFGFLLGLVGCTERNPAFHKPTDGGASPPQDTAAVDTPINADRPNTDTPVPPKDAELRPDILRETRLDDSRHLDSEGETGPVLLDAREPDGRADTGVGADTTLAQDTGVDAWLSDAAVIDPTDVPPAPSDAEQTDVPTLAEDAPIEIDGPAGDAGGVGDVLPDAEEPDAWPDAENVEPDSQPATDA